MHCSAEAFRKVVRSIPERSRGHDRRHVNTRDEWAMRCDAMTGRLPSGSYGRLNQKTDATKWIVGSEMLIIERKTLQFMARLNPVLRRITVICIVRSKYLTLVTRNVQFGRVFWRNQSPFRKYFVLTQCSTKDAVRKQQCLSSPSPSLIVTKVAMFRTRSVSNAMYSYCILKKMRIGLRAEYLSFDSTRRVPWR